MNGNEQNLIRILEFAFIVWVLWMVIKYAVRAGTRRNDPPADAGIDPKRTYPTTSAPRPSAGTTYSPITQRPVGQYRVRGVDRATKMDTTWVCTAESPENAKAKGELEGILVTSVEPA